MSASPAERTPGHTPGRTPNGAGPPAKIRRPKPVDPLVRPKPRKAAPTTAATSKLKAQVNGENAQKDALTAPAYGAPRLTTEALLRAAPATANHPSSSILDATAEPTASGFSSPAVAESRDYPLMLLPQASKEGLRYHVARFASKKAVDVTHEGEFTRPVRLHRRDPRAPALGASKEELDPKDAAAAEERDKQEMMRQQRAAQRELEMAEVAPSANLNSKRGGAGGAGGAKKKTQQVLRKDETEEQRASTRLKYEEALPWHLEDFDNKQAWVGSYEAALSETYAQIVFRDGRFYITPVEKWYKFTQKRNFGKTDDEIRADLLQKDKRRQDPGFLVRERQAAKQRTDDDKIKKAQRGLFVAPGSSSLSGTSSNPRIKRTDDAEEIDYEHVEDDDVEDPLYEGDQEDAKETEARIKRDQVNANVFDMKDEKTYERQEMIEKLERAAQKQDGRRVRRALKKREGNYVYDSDSDHPYSSETESEHSESGKSKEEDQKSDIGEKTVKPSHPPSGSSTKGNNTPSNRPSKHLEATQRVALANSIRRGGSPNLSEVSGNESSQPKKKKKKAKPGTASLLGTGTNTPNGPPSRPRSPLNGGPTSGVTVTQPTGAGNGKRKDSMVLKRPRVAGAASGSDGEGAGSGGEMSDGSRKRIRVKVTPGSKNQSPVGSRAGSPERTAPALGSRAASPAAPKEAPSDILLPSESVVRAALPEQGITMRDLLNKLGVGNLAPDRRKEFFAIIKSVSLYDKTTKVLKPMK